MAEIKLGDKVKCKITGFIGIAVAKTEFINGCIQYNVAGKVGKDNKLPIDSEVSIDSKSLEIIKPKEKKKEVKRRRGGPTRKGFVQKGF